MILWITGLLNNQYILPVSSVIAIIGPIIVMTINNFNMTDIEKIMLTNIKRVNYILSNIAFYSVGISLVMIILALIFKMNLDLQQYILLFGITFCMSFLLFIIYLGSIFTLINSLRIKVNFYIEEDNQRWYITRRINKKQVLFRGIKNNQRYIEVSRVYEKEIFRDVEEGEERDAFFKVGNTAENWMMCVGGIGFILTQSILFLFDMRSYLFLIYATLHIVSSLPIIVAMVSKRNKKVYKNFLDHEKNKNSIGKTAILQNRIKLKRVNKKFISA